MDGRVSIPVTGLRVANSKHVFTIIQLNLTFFNGDPANFAFNANLENHSVARTLPELVADLRRNKS